ncbi:hypothetical protein PRIC1_002881 [Phytophthora ramorum]
MASSNAFVLCKVRHSVSLSPCHAMEPRVGIEQELTEQLMRYSEALKGVVLSFSDVQLARPNGTIVNEMPYIHCKVQADALVFRPKEGMKLRGIVNKIGSNHVGMLFAGVFNGSVSEAELPKGYVHNYAQDCWLGEDGSSISVENEVEVKVLRVHVAGGMIAIEATMRFGGANAVKSTVTKPKKATHLDLSAKQPVKVAEPVKEKKSKKSKHLNLAVVEEPVKTKKAKKVKHLNLAGEVPTAEPVKEKAKKSKKRKHDKPAEEEVAQEETTPVEAEVKPKKHKDKDAKKKKLKKSKHD